MPQAVLVILFFLLCFETCPAILNPKENNDKTCIIVIFKRELEIFYINSFVVVFMCLGKGKKDEVNFNFSFKL